MKQLPFLSLLLSMIGCMFFVGTTSCEAQEKKEKRFVRFLPLGEMPPFRFEIRDGVRVEIPAAPGSIPPPQVQIAMGETAPLDTTLRLEQFSEKCEIPAGITRVAVREKNGDQLKAWHEAQLPETGDALVCLWRDPKEKTWAKARSLVVADALAAFPVGSLRMINLSPTKIKVEMEKNMVEIAPAKVQIIGLAREITPMRVSALDAQKEWRVIYQTGVTQNNGERGNLVVYLADGEDPRSPLKVWAGREVVR